MGRIWDLSRLPHLDETQHIDFQVDPTCDDVIAIGGNLSPGLLLSAYRQGLFPWYNEGENIYWWSPRQRFVIFLDDLHISKSLCKKMRRSLVPPKSGVFGENSPARFSLDEAFAKVIGACAARRREATWITAEMQYAYIKLHALGYAHSAELWLRRPDAGEFLAGGLYGVSLGHCFYGESMFSLVPDASKMAFAALGLFLRDQGFRLVDCQQESAHFERFGARLLPREEFESCLHRFLTGRVCWQDYRAQFPDGPSLRELLRFPDSTKI
ncbi:MAG: leucyl/phenylalanyl-tRNA--protein transferase [Spirochaetota bacterium]